MQQKICSVSDYILIERFPDDSDVTSIKGIRENGCAIEVALND